MTQTSCGLKSLKPSYEPIPQDLYHFLSSTIQKENYNFYSSFLSIGSMLKMRLSHRAKIA